MTKSISIIIVSLSFKICKPILVLSTIKTATGYLINPLSVINDDFMEIVAVH